MKTIMMIGNHDLVLYNFRKELIERFIEIGYKVIITCPHGNKTDKLIELGCEFIETKVNRHGLNLIQDLKLLKSYKVIMKKLEPDVVLTYTIKPNIYGGIAAKSLRIPYISNITGLGSALENRSVLQFFLIRLYKFSFSKVSRIYFQNQDNMDFFKINKLYENKHFLLPGSGVNIAHFKYKKYPENNHLEFSFISRIMKEKGIELFLKLSKDIKSQFPNTLFHVCGFCEDDYVSILHEYENNNFIIYHGMIEDIRSILARSNCVIHPTYYPEGLSNILLEASATGRPVITTNRSGCKEAVIDNVTGYLVEPLNYDDLLIKTLEFIKLTFFEKEKMGQNARKFVVENFNRDIVVNSYVETIYKIFNEKNN